MKYTGKNHTFAICAYKESPFLEECILSLLDQTVPSTIIIVTATDNAYIRNLADKYHELHINHGETGITQDWMFAYRSAKTELMTIAHQDDTYDRFYTETVLQKLSEAKKPLIAFTDYGELRNGKTVTRNPLLNVKRTKAFSEQQICPPPDSFLRLSDLLSFCDLRQRKSSGTDLFPRFSK